MEPRDELFHLVVDALATVYRLGEVLQAHDLDDAADAVVDALVPVLEALLALMPEVLAAAKAIVKAKGAAP